MTSRPPAWLAGVLVLAWAATAPAHPHAYVVYAVVLPVGPASIDAVGFVFAFDEAFSALIRYAAQWGDPAEAHARTLRQLPHEIEIAYDGAPVELEPPTDLEVETAGDRITYRFRVPLRTPLRPPGTLEVSVQDHGFFTAFALRGPTPVEVQATGGATATCERARTPSGAPGPLRCRYRPAP